MMVGAKRKIYSKYAAHLTLVSRQQHSRRSEFAYLSSFCIAQCCSFIFFKAVAKSIMGVTGPYSKSGQLPHASLGRRGNMPSEPLSVSWCHNDARSGIGC